ncbi:zinc finger protein [Trichonephila clavipes]|nr:zinc finger protein [Trichonephila clavipes]
MSGRFLKVTVADDVDYRALSQWLEKSGVEFKSFMLKQDRPVKVVLRDLPSNTEPEDIKTEIEAEGFRVLKISQMKNYRTKASMPLFYLLRAKRLLSDWMQGTVNIDSDWLPWGAEI